MDMDMEPFAQTFTTHSDVSNLKHLDLPDSQIDWRSSGVRIANRQTHDRFSRAWGLGSPNLERVNRAGVGWWVWGEPFFQTQEGRRSEAAC